jgi:hypothetical protein
MNTFTYTALSSLLFYSGSSLYSIPKSKISSSFQWTSVSSKITSVTIPQYFDLSIIITLYTCRCMDNFLFVFYSELHISFWSNAIPIIQSSLQPKANWYLFWNVTESSASQNMPLYLQRDCLFLGTRPQPISHKSLLKLLWVDHEISQTNVHQHSINVWVLVGVRNRVFNVLLLEKETE